jgi:hypothetical protein
METSMSFRISGLPLARFEPLFALSDAELASRGIIRRVVEEPGAPCRVSMRDAEPGETVLLLNYEHQPAASPFRSSHAIYVRQAARETYESVDEIPEVLRRRILSVRAFDGDGMMVDADVVDGREVETVVERLLGDSRVVYLHAHYAKPGCFAARIDRA